MSNNSQPANEPSILGKFASVVSILGASLYFTGWIYRWAYYSFFQLNVNSLNLPVESFLIVPIQVFFGNVSAIVKTAAALILITLGIYLTLWLLYVLGSVRFDNVLSFIGKFPMTSKRQQANSRNSLIARILRAIKSLLRANIARIWQSFSDFSSHQFNSIKFLRSLLNETVIVAWVLIALFFLAKSQGLVDARRDAINNTSTLPVVTLVASDAYLSVGRNPEDTATPPKFQKYRFIGDLGLLESLKEQVYNDTLDAENSRVWRLLLERDGWIYVFRTLPTTAAINERPLVLMLKESDSGEPLMLLSPEYTKPSSK